jgi:excinuclease ABC subunit C
MTAQSDILREKLAQLPDRPGVYLMKDTAGAVLYVGKAASLRSRARSYFQVGAALTPRAQMMVERVADLDYIATDSEIEALVLEHNLIKRHRPRFNVRLRDDKKYPYVKITFQEEFPTLTVVRNMERDGAEYFGPFASTKAMWETIRQVRRMFGLRQLYIQSANRKAGCPWKPRPRAGGQAGEPPKPRARPCLDYYIGLCTGPCANLIEPEEYRTRARDTALFLAGRQEGLVNSLKQQMEEAAAELNFERAARLRDQIEALERALAEQKVVLNRDEDLDILAHALQEDMGCVVVAKVRQGKLIDQEAHMIEGVAGLTDGEVLAGFIGQYYPRAAAIPPVILLAHRVPQPEDAVNLLEGLRGAKAEPEGPPWRSAHRADLAKVEILVARRGTKRKLVEMAANNAALHLKEATEAESTRQRRAQEAVAELQEAFELPVPPQRIECYDISTTRGQESVGSMVTFVDGLPKKSDYRRFKIACPARERAPAKPNDPAMMKEVLERRLRAAQARKKFAALPDLIILDGGKGQLSAALKAMEELGMTIPAAALAKEHEFVYLPGRQEAIILPSHSKGLHLLQQVRDEAHRFAQAYHHTLRRKQAQESVLDSIPGIGAQRRRALMQHFRSLQRLRSAVQAAGAATVEELAAIPGMTRQAAEAVAAYFGEAQEEP